MATASNGSAPPVVPRTIDAFHEPRHVDERFGCPRRPIDRGLAADAVEHGAVEANPIARDGRSWRYRYRVDGCDVVVGAADAREHFRDFVVLTAYVDVVDARAAYASRTWSNFDVNVAALLQYLKGDVPVAESGLYPKRIHVTDPVEYHGHRLINKNGYNVPVCVDCGFESTDGDAYKRRSCR
jgi:hypothetical protein